MTELDAIEALEAPRTEAAAATVRLAAEENLSWTMPETPARAENVRRFDRRLIGILAGIGVLIIVAAILAAQLANRGSGVAGDVTGTAPASTPTPLVNQTEATRPPNYGADPTQAPAVEQVGEPNSAPEASAAPANPFAPTAPTTPGATVAFTPPPDYENPQPYEPQG